MRNSSHDRSAKKRKVCAQTHDEDVQMPSLPLELLPRTNGEHGIIALPLVESPETSLSQSPVLDDNHDMTNLCKSFLCSYSSSYSSQNTDDQLFTNLTNSHQVGAGHSSNLLEVTEGVNSFVGPQNAPTGTGAALREDRTRQTTFCVISEHPT